MKTKIGVAVLLTLNFKLLTLNCFSASYLGVREFGEPVSGAGARSVAMGSTGLSRGKDSAVFRLNPAAGADLEDRRLSLTLGPSFLTEKVVETSTALKFRD